MEASRTSAEADARLHDYETKLAAARSRAQDERHQIRTEAARHQATVVDKARAEAQKTTEAARRRVENESERARQDLAVCDRAEAVVEEWDLRLREEP